MAHVTIEFVIMMPLLLAQIFLLPITANWIMNMWVDKRTTLALNEAAGHLGSTIQQTYFILNHTTMSSTILVNRIDIPSNIENHVYTATAIMQPVAGLDSSRVLKITLRLETTGTRATYTVVLGQNSEWEESILFSNSTSRGVKAIKYPSEGGFKVKISFSN